MSETTPKMTAAMAAVLYYIQSETEAVIAASAAAPSAEAARPEAAAPAPPKLWGISGRQDMMQVRNMMQLKAFHGARAR